MIAVEPSFFVPDPTVTPMVLAVVHLPAEVALVALVAVSAADALPTLVVPLVMLVIAVALVVDALFAASAVVLTSLIAPATVLEVVLSELSVLV